MAPKTAGAKFLKSGSNRIVETDATDVVLDKDHRFQRLDSATKKELLACLGVRGAWTHRTFDLVMTPAEVGRIDVSNVAQHAADITLIEIKSTRKPIPDASLSGFFFGATKTEYDLAAALGDRLKYAFVVLNDRNVYGRSFFVLLSHQQVEARTRTRRTQYQVNFKSGMKPDGTEIVFTSVPPVIAAEAAGELPESEQA